MAVRRLAETQPESFAFTQENRAWAERQVAKFPEGRQASAVIQLLWRAQEQEGWVTKPAIEGVAKMLGMPTIRVLEVATFYTMFHLEPVGRKAHVQVCGTTPCMLGGSDDLIRLCRERIHPDQHHLSADGDFSWEEVECLGACVNAPMAQIGADTYEDLTRESFSAVLDAFARGEHPRPGPQNGRHYSMSIAGPTTLRDITYAEDDVRLDALEGLRRNAARATGNGAVNIVGDAPRSDVEGNIGGEILEAEQARRTDDAPKPAGGGAVNPATTAAAGQEIGRVEPTGRSDEAAARATPGSEPASKDQSTRRGKGGAAANSAQPRSDRDSEGCEDA